MLTLKPNEVCKYSNQCPNNKTNANLFCQGTNPDRKTTFECNLVSDTGIFTEGFRSSLDQTGKMKVVTE